MGAYRIVFAGPIGAGKTTAIGALSDVPPISTEVASAEAEAVGKATTTVAFDLGQVLLESGDLVQLYGAPGQARFDFMWPMISENAIGAVILADNRRPDTIQVTLDYVREFAPRSLPATAWSASAAATYTANPASTTIRTRSRLRGSCCR